MPLVLVAAAPLILQTLTPPQILTPSRPPKRNDIFNRVCRKRCAIPKLRRVISAFCFPKNELEQDSAKNSYEKNSRIKHLLVFQSWDIPWDWKTVVYIMMPYLMSIIFAGIVESRGLTGSLLPYSQNLQDHLHNVDEEAVRLFTDQLLKTAVKLSIIYVFVSPYRPFPVDIFSYRWGNPLNLQSGWILWGGAGLVMASSTAFLIKTFVIGSSAGQMQNEAESLVRLLPLIGTTKISTFCLLSILGILAPLCEETLYRGFLMTSLTKWLPVPVSVVVSSAVFALAHQSPGKSMEIFIFGTVLGLVYAQTRNLMTPITMHACWNIGVILLLTVLQSQGYDIQQYVL